MKRPWPLMVWAAPFVASTLLVVWVAATVCALLTLCYDPRRAAEVFDRIRSA